jgi:hypothetical protein
LLKSAVTLANTGNEPFDKVSSIRGANTLLQDSRIKTDEINGQIKEADHTQIKGDQRTRAEEPGPL